MKDKAKEPKPIVSDRAIEDALKEKEQEGPAKIAWPVGKPEPGRYPYTGEDGGE